MAPNTAYSCALAQVDSAGYTLSSSDRTSGFLRAERVENTTYRDVLAVTILPQTNGQTEMHVTAETYGTALSKDGEASHAMVKASDRVTGEATLLVTRCVGGAPAPAASSARSY